MLVNNIIKKSLVYDVFLNNKNSKEIIVFGFGKRGKFVVNRLLNDNFKISMIIDNDIKKQGTLYKDIAIKSFHEIIKLVQMNKINNYQIIIASTYYEEIEKLLGENGIENFFNAYPPVINISETNQVELLEFNEYFNRNQDLFENVFNLLDDSISKEVFVNVLLYRLTGNKRFIQESQYSQYNHNYVKAKPNEVIIDGGAYIGDTVQVFNDFVDSKCIIHSFEPSKVNFQKLKEYLIESQTVNVIANCYGLDEKVGHYYMESDMTKESPANFLSTSGNELINITTIDSYVMQKNISKIDLIKLDIENYELAALKGAKDTIKKFKPKLQICVYHTPQQLTEIALFLSKEYGYKLYLGHHSQNISETVLYAYN